MTADAGQTITLRTTALTVRYGDTVAADAVSFDARRGEIVGLLGPNGAGKTSVIRALTTIVPVASGSATVAGHDLSDAAGIRSSIGVLPESNGYPGSQTARAYLTFYGQLFGLPRAMADERARTMLDRVGLGSNLHRIATFSRGMRQRLGLARALLNRPMVLFLDEPTLGLDPAGKEDILAQLTQSALDDGTCVVLCSHLLDEVERVCDRVAIMDHGRIVAQGTVDEVVTRADVGGHGRVHVAAADVARADAALRSCGAVTSSRFDNTRPGDIDIELDAERAGSGEVLRCLIEAGVEPRAFDLRGARLSDAFLALTNGTRATAPRATVVGSPT